MNVVYSRLWTTSRLIDRAEKYHKDDHMSIDILGIDAPIVKTPK